MKIEVLNKAIVPTYFNAYVVECQAMYGDADGYGSVEVGGFTKGQDEELLKEFLEFCKRMELAYPHGRGGYDDYHHVEGFDKWFYVDNLSEEEYEALPDKVKELSTDWPHDPQGDGIQASFDGYKVYYYDETGVKYNTSITL